MAGSTDVEERERWRLRELLAGPDALLDWVPRVHGRAYEPPRHLRPMADVLSRASLGGVNAILAAAVRHGKTTLLEAAVVRHLLLRPDSWVIWVSHGTEAAEFRGQEIRGLAQRAGLVLRKETGRAGRWQAKAGGGLLSLGIGAGAATGFGCALLVADDLFASRQDAESDAVREMTYATLIGTFLSRMEPQASAVICGARWHRDDVAGRLLADAPGKWEYVNLPAIGDDGQALWPQRWSLQALEERRATMTPYEWAALWQGQPIARGTSMLATPASYTRAELLAYLHDGPRLAPDSPRRPWQVRPRLVLSVDPAVSEKHSADYSVIAVLALKGSGPTAEGWVVDLYRDRVSMPRLVEQIGRMRRDWGASAVLVEAVAGFAALPQLLRSLDPHMPITPIQPKGDKQFRAEPLAAAITSGRFRVPESAPWLPVFLDELASFPVGRHDDQVDAAAQGFNLVALHPPRRRIDIGALQRHLPFG